MTISRDEYADLVQTAWDKVPMIDEIDAMLREQADRIVHCPTITINHPVSDDKFQIIKYLYMSVGWGNIMMVKDEYKSVISFYQ